MQNRINLHSNRTEPTVYVENLNRFNDLNLGSMPWHTTFRPKGVRFLEQGVRAHEHEGLYKRLNRRSI